MKTSARIGVWLFTLTVCFAILWPVYWIVKSSFTRADKLYEMPIQYLPVNLTLDSYRTLFGASNVWSYIGNTVLISIATLLLSVVFCALAGYAFARTSTRGTRLAFGFLLFSTMIPATVTALPLMVMWRGMGLTDTLQGTTLLYFSMVIPFSTIMYSSYIKQIPESVEEAALIDGTGIFGAFRRVVFPLLKPVAATLCIINFINCVNEFFIPLLFTSKNVKVMSLLMNTIPRVNQHQLPWDTISAAGCLMLLPSILFILIFEKNIMEGLMMGSIKQ